jgi:hypothetical protein
MNSPELVRRLAIYYGLQRVNLLPALALYKKNRVMNIAFMLLLSLNVPAGMRTNPWLSRLGIPTRGQRAAKKPWTLQKGQPTNTLDRAATDLGLMYKCIYKYLKYLL